MPVNYGILQGKIINSIPYKNGTDHFQIEVKADKLYRIAVDVYSQFAGSKIKYAPDGNTTLETDRMVMFYKDENFKHPILSKLLQVNTGFTPKVNLPSTLWLDYLRTVPPLFPLSAMRVVTPKSKSAPAENLNDDIGPWVQKATNNPNATVFAFGSGWDDTLPGSHPDTVPYFNPNPTAGIHDIHMNQGDDGKEEKYNGINQDGALLFYFKDTAKWVGMFFRFQNQKTTTNTNGDPV